MAQFPVIPTDPFQFHLIFERKPLLAHIGYPGGSHETIKYDHGEAKKISPALSEQCLNKIKDLSDQNMVDFRRGYYIRPNDHYISGQPSRSEKNETHRGCCVQVISRTLGGVRIDADVPKGDANESHIDVVGVNYFKSSNIQSSQKSHISFTWLQTTPPCYISVDGAQAHYEETALQKYIVAPPLNVLEYFQESLVSLEGRLHYLAEIDSAPAETYQGNYSKLANFRMLNGPLGLDIVKAACAALKNLSTPVHPQ